MDKIEDEQDVEIGIAQIKSSNRDEDDDDFF